MSVYRKDVRHLDELDLYVLADLYDVKSHAVFHAIKKLICAGKRGAKDYEQDLMEAIESIERELQMTGLKDEPEWEGRHPSLRFAVRGEQGQFVYGKTEPKDGTAFWVRPEIAEFDEKRIDAIGQNGNDGEHYEAKGWIPWDGGECPVPNGTKVDVRLRSGEESFSLEAIKDMLAGPAFWIKDDMSSDIVAYRLA